MQRTITVPNSASGTPRKQYNKSMSSTISQDGLTVLSLTPIQINAGKKILAFFRLTMAIRQVYEQQYFSVLMKSV